MEGTGIVHQYYFLSMAAREFFLSSAQIHMIAVITEFQIHGKKKRNSNRPSAAHACNFTT